MKSQGYFLFIITMNIRHTMSQDCFYVEEKKKKHDVLTNKDDIEAIVRLNRLRMIDDR